MVASICTNPDAQFHAGDALEAILDICVFRNSAFG
jgi:hypothetical protein